MNRIEKAQKIGNILDDLYPTIPVPLEHSDSYTLLVAVVLSAQATDIGVNRATKKLFEIADTPEKMVKLGKRKLISHIKTIGLYRTKAQNVIGLSKKLITDHESKVPKDRDALIKLPGVGRKTANVVLNIAFGVPEDLIDYAQVEKVAKDSQIYDFINTLPKKFQTPIGEKGITLSGGQKQRIAIARALYNDPSILIFDESTSALDVETENNLLDSIYNLKNKKTLIIISHKESILHRCETIYKIENKKIVKIK